MIEKLNEILNHALVEINDASIERMEVLVDIKNKYLSKKSELMGMMSLLGKMEPEERKVFGQAVNEARVKIQEAIDAKLKKAQDAKLEKDLEKEKIDITLPGTNLLQGGRNPFYIIRDEIISIFISMGYEVKLGEEVESDKYNFELLNIPKDHPARDMQDSLYFDANTLLRTHTSPAQAHAMEEANGKAIRIICPGKTYRRDDDDMTHSHQFAQIEGLVIDEGINLGNLVATLDMFVKRLFGENRSIRLRNSYFPFTEPSFEVDVSCANCGGKGCSMCKGSGYIEILGCGMVHPNVLKMNGYDPEKYSGFAFGVGVERLAILRYGIDDIRKFYTNDLRFLAQFKKGDNF